MLLCAEHAKEATTKTSPLSGVGAAQLFNRLYQGVSQSKIEGGGGGDKRKSSIYHSLVDLNF